jgi:predicted RNase H-like HicB family nuclease
MPGGGKEEKASGMRSSSVLLSTETQKTSALPGIAATQSWGEGSKTQDYARSQYIPYSLTDCPVFGGNYSMSNFSIRIEIFKEGEEYVAFSPELNVSSFGETIEEAKLAIKEAIEAFMEECEKMGTLGDVLEEAGFKRNMRTGL